MKKRCNNKNNKSYKDYGARNIKVCDEWNNDFLAFKLWAYQNGYNDNLTIERVDVNKGYCPSNCKWIESEEQAYNKRLQINNKTGIKGTSYINGKYVVRISYKNKRYYIGTFNTKEEAMKKRKEAEKKLWGR